MINITADHNMIKNKAVGLSTSRALTLVAIIFVMSLTALGLLYSQFPELEV